MTTEYSYPWNMIIFHLLDFSSSNTLLFSHLHKQFHLFRFFVGQFIAVHHVNVVCRKLTYELFLVVFLTWCATNWSFWSRQWVEVGLSLWKKVWFHLRCFVWIVWPNQLSFLCSPIGRGSSIVYMESTQHSSLFFESDGHGWVVLCCIIL